MLCFSGPVFRALGRAHLDGLATVALCVFPAVAISAVRLRASEKRLLVCPFPHQWPTTNRDFGGRLTVPGSIPACGLAF